MARTRKAVTNPSKTGVQPAVEARARPVAQKGARESSKAGFKSKPASRKSAAKREPRNTSEGWSSQMNEQFTKQAQAMLDAAKDARIPEGFQTFAQDTVEKSREAYEKLADAAQQNAKTFEEVLVTSQAGAKTIGEKLMRNSMANTEAAFDAAQAMTRARSLPEFFRLQADYVQQQVAAASAQTKELFELSSKVSKQTFDTMNSATQKSFDALKK
jgi:phasin